MKAILMLQQSFLIATTTIPVGLDEILHVLEAYVRLPCFSYTEMS